MPASNNLQLNCLLWEKRRTPKVYPVQVGRDGTVFDLMKEICKRQKAFGASLELDITLLKCSTIPTSPMHLLEASIEAWQPDDDEDILQPAGDISLHFPSTPSEDLVHIIVVATNTFALNCVFIGSDNREPHGIQVEISRKETVEKLKCLINQEENLSTPPEALQLWTPVEPLRFETQRLQDQFQGWSTKTNAVSLQYTHYLLDIFPFILPDGIVHIVVKAPSLKTTDEELKISSQERDLFTAYLPSNSWSKRDLLAPQNQVILRTITRSQEDLPSLGIFQHTITMRSILHERRQAPLLAKEKVLSEYLTSDLFEQIYGETGDNIDETIARDDFENKAEVLSFVHLSQVYRHVAEFVGGDKSSTSVRKTIFCGLFTAPSLLVALVSGKPESKFTYHLDQALPYSMLISFNDTVEATYTPESNFTLGLKDFLVPLISAEVAPDLNGPNRYRMLFQAVVAARVAKYLLKDSSDTFVLMAIYINKEFVVERYLVSQAELSMEVQIVQEKFNLVDIKEAAEFLLTLYNYQKYAEQKKNSFDLDRSAGLKKAVALYMGNLESFDSVKEATDKANQINVLPQLKGVGEVGEDIFYSTEITSQLAQRNCRYVVFLTSKVALVLHTPSKFDFILKYIPANDPEEDILRSLSGLESDENLQNHTVRPFWFWRTSKGTLVSMPICGGKLGDTFLGPPHDLLWLSQQIIEGVAFMHRHGVAHLDLKPANVLVRNDGYVSIIDFGVSERVEDVDDMMEGLVGTRGYTAPEIGREPFSPILADVWACGYLLRYLSSEYEESTPHRDVILDIHTKLMHKDPRQRPHLSDVLAQLRKIAGSKPNNGSYTMPAHQALPWEVATPLDEEPEY